MIGTPGAGKSTLLRAIQQSNPGTYITVQEPVQVWEQSGLLQKFYEDPATHAFAFQSMALTTVAEATQTAYATATGGKILIAERDIHSSDYIFAQPLVRQHMSGWQKDTYRALYGATARRAPATTHYIWLDVPPEVCHLRMQKRGRKAEDTVTVEQLRVMDARIREWVALPQIERKLMTVSVSNLDKITTVIDEAIQAFIHHEEYGITQYGILELK